MQSTQAGRDRPGLARAGARGLVAMALVLIAAVRAADAGTIAVGQVDLLNFSFSGPIHAICFSNSCGATSSTIAEGTRDEQVVVGRSTLQSTGASSSQDGASAEASTTGGAVGAASQSARAAANTPAGIDFAVAGARHFGQILAGAGTVSAAVTYQVTQHLTTGQVGDRADVITRASIELFPFATGNTVRSQFEERRVVADGADFFGSPSGVLTASFNNPFFEVVQFDFFAFAQVNAFGTGASPGQTMENPLLPDTVGPGGFGFNLGLSPGGLGLDFPLFLDPPVVIGYDYAVVGSTFATVVLQTGFGDDLFDIVVGETLFSDVAGGTTFDIIANGFEGGVSMFGIRGIETELGLDPSDPTAFPTGVTFTGGSSLTVTMTPLTDGGDIGGDRPSVPEPPPAFPLAAALAGVGAVAWRWPCPRRPAACGAGS